MYPSLWGGFPSFNVHEDRQGAYYGCYCSLLYQLISWLIYPLGKVHYSGHRWITYNNIWVRLEKSSHLNWLVSSCLWRVQRKNKEGRRREEISLEFQLYFAWFFARLLCNEQRTSRDHWRTVVSSKSGVEFTSRFRGWYVQIQCF